MHFAHNVTPAHELLFNVDLGYGGPIWILLYLLTNVFVLQHVDIFELLNAVRLQQHHHVSAESTLWHLASALHEHNHIVVIDPLVKLLGELLRCHGSLRFRFKIAVRIVTAEASRLRSDQACRLFADQGESWAWSCEHLTRSVESAENLLFHF